MVALALAGLPFAASAHALASGQCGDGVALVVRNPDLRPGRDGVVHASGDVLVQLQAVGARALDVAKLTVSLGKPVPRALESCGTLEWFTGAYVKDHRADAEPRDGFFVALSTRDVPDGEYALAVHAYDEAGREMARYWTRALVANGCAPAPCVGEASRAVRAHDKVAPWPLVLPGDGVQSNAVGGFTVEFGERLGRDGDGAPLVHAFVNGARIPLAPVDGRVRDDDPVPPNAVDDAPLQRRAFGPTFHWPGTVHTDDHVRVVAVDENGNRAVKELHVGDPAGAARVPAAGREGSAPVTGQVLAPEPAPASASVPHRAVPLPAVLAVLAAGAVAVVHARTRAR